MPILPFEHPQTGERREFLVPLEGTDSDRFSRQIDETGIVWKRVYEVPHMGIDTKVDPFNERDYINKTGTKKGTYGDLLEESAELSAKRAEKAGGEDPVKEKFYKQWSDKRPGQVHPEKKKEEANKKLKKYGVQID